MKLLSKTMKILAVLLSNIMCAHVFYTYGAMSMGVRYAAFSAPPESAFILAAPYAIGILACLILSLICRNKSKNASRD